MIEKSVLIFINLGEREIFPQRSRVKIMPTLFAVSLFYKGNAGKWITLFVPVPVAHRKTYPKYILQNPRMHTASGFSQFYSSICSNYFCYTNNGSCAFHALNESKRNVANWCHELKGFAKWFYHAASSPTPCGFFFPFPFSVSILFFKWISLCQSPTNHKSRLLASRIIAFYQVSKEIKFTYVCGISKQWK